jgi:predicted ATPase/transcriptional regulator with XRE-family HTH domain
MNEGATTFGVWLRRQRRQFDLTQLELAQRMACSVVTVRKLERDELRPSKQLAERLVHTFNIPTEQQPALLAFARGLEPVPQWGHTAADAVLSSTVQATGLPTRQHHLSTPMTPLVGRERELADLQRLLAQPDVRLVTILGAGGMGKSHLAQELARRQLERTQAGIFFVALAAVRDVESMTTAILDALGYPLQTDQRSPEQQLLDYVQPKQLLLVLDNFEHLLTGTGLVNALLRVAPGVKVVVTSRERLLLSVETLYVLHSLAYPHEATTTDLLDYAAIKLFLQRARHSQPAFAPTATDSAAIARICRLVAGMPLGILLAAAWVNQLSVPVIADEISQNLDFLATEWRDLPERHRSIRAVFVHSWRRLTEAERTIFMQLALFRGGFTRQAAQTVTGASLPQLRTLVNQSLLQVDNDERYTLHELLRQYAEAELTTADQRAEAATRHCAYYADGLTQVANDLKGPQQARVLTLIESEHDNLRTAWAWAIAQRDEDRVAQLGESLGFFYEWRGRFQEGERAFAQAIDVFAAVKGNPESSALPRLLTWQATFSQFLGKQTKAAHLLHEALMLVDSCKGTDQAAQRVRAAILHGLGQYVYATGDRLEAHRLFAESLTSYQRCHDAWGAAIVLLSIQRITRSLSALGNPLQHQRSAEAAITMVLESVGIFRTLGDQAHLATALDALGTVLLYLGQAKEAQAALTECLAIHQALGTMNRSFISTLIALAVSNEFLGLYEQASLQAQEARRVAQRVGDLYCMRRASCVLSSVALAQQRYVDVQRYVQDELHLLTVGQFKRPGTILQLVNCGLANYRLGNFPQAAQQLVAALREGQAIHAMRGVVHGLLLGSLLLVAQGKPVLAVEIHALAQLYPLVAHCRWCEEVAGHDLTAIAATLPADIVAAARARGQASDLASTVASLLQEFDHGGLCSPLNPILRK